MGKIYIKLDGNLVPAGAGIKTAETSSKEEQTKTITPNFSSGDVVVTPDSGKVLSQVTVVKDSDLTSGNIKKGVNIFGVVGSVYMAIEITQAGYDSLQTKDENMYYIIVEA